MKFGETLDATLFPLWKAYYFDYEALKDTLETIKETFPYAELFKQHHVHIENDPTLPFRFFITRVHFSYTNSNGQQVDATMRVSTVRSDRRLSLRSQSAQNGVDFAKDKENNNTNTKNKLKKRKRQHQPASERAGEGDGSQASCSSSSCDSSDGEVASSEEAIQGECGASPSARKGLHLSDVLPHNSRNPNRVPPKGFAKVDGQDATQYVFAGKLAAVFPNNEPFDETRVDVAVGAEPIFEEVVSEEGSEQEAADSSLPKILTDGASPPTPSENFAPLISLAKTTSHPQQRDLSAHASSAVLNKSAFNEIQPNALDFGANLGLDNALFQGEGSLTMMGTTSRPKPASPQKKAAIEANRSLDGSVANAPSPEGVRDDSFATPQRTLSALQRVHSISSLLERTSVANASFRAPYCAAEGDLRAIASNVLAAKGARSAECGGVVVRREQSIVARRHHHHRHLGDDAKHTHGHAYRWVITEQNHMPLGPKDDFNHVGKNAVGKHGRVGYARHSHEHQNNAPLGITAARHREVAESKADADHKDGEQKKEEKKRKNANKNKQSKKGANGDQPRREPSYSNPLLQHYSANDLPFTITMSFIWEGSNADPNYYNPAIAHAVYLYQRLVSLAIAPKIQWELTKISTFYIKQSHILSHAALLCVDSAKLWQEMTTAERTKLRTAYRQTYLMLQVLQQYCDLNTQAIAKFLKKLDKNTFQDTLSDYSKALMDANFRMGKESRNMMLQAVLVEEYAKYVCDGKQKPAHEFLESEMSESVTQNKSNTSILISLAFLWGLVIAMLAMVIQLLVSLEDGGRWTIATPAWDLMATKHNTYLILLPFTLICLPFLFSINVMVWEYFGINFAFVFELDPLFHFTGAELMRDSLLYVLVWELCVFSFLRINLNNVYCPLDPLAYSGPSVTPLWCIFPLFIVLYLFIAIKNYFSEQQRSCFSAQVMLNIICSPFKAVRFADFFIADQLTSITSPIFELQFYWCTFTTDTVSQCVTGRGVSAPFLNIFPSLWRLLQCLRRYYDEPIKRRGAFPNLINALKYFLSVIDVITWMLYSIAKYEGATTGDGAYWVAISFAFASAFVSQLYRWVWDVVVDAGIWIRVEDERLPANNSADVEMDGEDTTAHEDDEDQVYQRAHGSGGGGVGVLDTQEKKQVAFVPSASPLTENQKKTKKASKMAPPSAKCCGASASTFADEDDGEHWHWELRKDRIYKAWWPYFTFLAIDLGLRMMWLVKFYAPIHQPFGFAVWSCIEIFRRFLWNFFRMENEHVSNTENYRATKLAPIPQKDISRWDIEIDEKFMAAKKISVDNFTTVTRYFAFLPDKVKAKILEDSRDLLAQFEAGGGGGSSAQMQQLATAKWAGQPNEGKSRVFSEFPEEIKVLLLLRTVGDATMVEFKDQVCGEASMRSGDALMNNNDVQVESDHQTTQFRADGNATTRQRITKSSK